MTERGVVLQSWPSVVSLTNQKHHITDGLIEYWFIIVDDSVVPEPLTITVEWFYRKVEKTVFTGRFYVIGKGDVFVLCSSERNASMFDVYHNGENVGVFVMILIIDWFL